MSLVHIPKKRPYPFWEETKSEETLDGPNYITVEEVSSLPPPALKTGVDPRLEITTIMIEAVQERQNTILPEINKLPKLLDAEVNNSNRQLNHLANVQEQSKKYLMILSGAVGIMTVLAAVKLVHRGVGFWRWFKKYKPKSIKKVAGEGNGAAGEKKRRRRIRRSHQRDWRISEG